MVDLVAIDTAPDHDAALILERRWIRGLRAIGAELLNSPHDSYPVKCIETGERYRSIQLAADANGLDRHLMRSAFLAGQPYGDRTFEVIG